MARVVTTYHRGGTAYRGQGGIVYRKTYEEIFSGATALEQPRRRAVTVRVYDRLDVLVANFSSNSQACPILNLSWELLDTGCGDFTLELATDPAFQHDYRVDIHLWNDTQPIYSGFIQRLPKAGTTERTTTYGGYGFLAMLNRMMVTATYATQNVRSIVSDLAAQMETRLVRVRADQAQIDQVSYTTKGSLEFLRQPLKDCFKQLADLAGGFVWGVDAERNLFFKTPNQDVDMHSWVGKHLDTFIPQEESDDIITVVYIKAGKVQSTLPTDSPFYKTNWLVDPIQNLDAIALWGIREGVYSAPSVLDQIDAALGATVWLANKSKPRQYASVRGLAYNGERLSCTGQARIVGKNGQQLVLPKKKLKFQLKPTGVDVSLELGDLDYSNRQWAGRLSAAVAAGELARQQSQKQL